MTYETNRDPGDETTPSMPLGSDEEYAYPVGENDIIEISDNKIVLRADTNRFRVGRLVVTDSLALFRLDINNLSRGEISGRRA